MFAAAVPPALPAPQSSPREVISALARIQRASQRSPPRDPPMAVSDGSVVWEIDVAAGGVAVGGRPKSLTMSARMDQLRDQLRAAEDASARRVQRELFPEEAQPMPPKSPQSRHVEFQFPPPPESQSKFQFQPEFIGSQFQPANPSFPPAPSPVASRPSPVGGIGCEQPRAGEDGVSALAAAMHAQTQAHERQHEQMVELVRQQALMVEAALGAGVRQAPAHGSAGSLRKVDPPPAFSGDKIDFEQWRRQLGIWEIVNKDISAERRGPLLLQSLSREVQQFVLSRMDVERVALEAGYGAVVALLDERFRRPDDSRAFEAFRAAVGCSRAQGQSLDDFVHEFERQWSAADKLGVWSDPAVIKAHLLVDRAGLSKPQRSSLFLQLDAERVRKGGDAAPMDFGRVRPMIHAIADAHAFVSAEPAFVSGSVEPAFVAVGGSKKQQQSPKQQNCGFCGMRGHVESQCFKKDRSVAEAAAADEKHPHHKSALVFLQRLSRKPKQGGAGGVGPQ
jgi:hypothetical protein